MKLLDILTKVGAGVIREVIPGSGLLVEAVNALLPDAVQISPDMTGDVVKQKLKGLPAGVRAEILNSIQP